MIPASGIRLRITLVEPSRSVEHKGHQVVVRAHLPPMQRNYWHATYQIRRHDSVRINGSISGVFATRHEVETAAINAAKFWIDQQALPL